MLGRRSQNPDLIPFNPEPERILRSRTPPITMAEETAKLMEYFTPSTYTTASCIRIHNTNANHYEIKPSIIQLLPSSYGLNKDPYKHLDKFLEVCSNVKIENLLTTHLGSPFFLFLLRIKLNIGLGL